MRKVWILIGVIVVLLGAVLLVLGTRGAIPLPVVGHGLPACQDGTWQRTPVEWPSDRQPSSADLVVVVMGGGRPNDVSVEIVRQNADAVVLQGWVCELNAPHSDVGHPNDVAVHLDAPLGDRPVLNPDGSLVCGPQNGWAGRCS